MSLVTIATSTYIELTKNLARLTRGNSEGICKLEVDNNKLTVYYRNSPEKTLLNVSYVDHYEVESSVSRCFFISVQELINVKIPEPGKTGFPKVEKLKLALEDSDSVTISYITHWRPESKPSTTSLKVLYSTPIKALEELEKYKDMAFTKEFSVPAHKLKELFSIINIYSSDATSKSANNILLKSKNNILTALSTDSSTAAKFSIPLDIKGKAEFEISVSPAVLKLCESFLGKSEDLCVFTIKHNKFFLKLNNSLMLFPTSSNIHELLMYLELFNDLPKIKGEIELKPFADSIKILISNSKTKFFKLKIEGSNNLLNLSSSGDDGKIVNLPVSLTSTLVGLIDAYLLTNIITKVKNEDRLTLRFDSNRNLWCLALNSVDLTFLIQGMS